MAEHSTFSASAADRWLACPGSIVMSAGKPDSTSIHAATGTVAHELLEESLKDPAWRLGLVVGNVWERDGYTIPITPEMTEAVETALGHIHEMTTGADIVWSERRVNYARWLGVPREQAFGTSDLVAIWVDRREVLIGDYKHGAGVEVDAMENVQMMLYAGGVLCELDDLGIEVDTVRLAIFQPRVRNAPSEWSMTRAELEAWLTGRARSGAASVLNAQGGFPDASEGALHPEWADTFLRAGDHCRWCKAKATCPKLREVVTAAVDPFGSPLATPEEFKALVPEILTGSDRHDVAWLAAALSKVDMIEDWCKAIRAESERRMLAGEDVPGWKLVQGKRGPRQWSDPAAAEEMLRKTFRLPIEQAYDLKLISPMTAEKLTKGDKPVIGERQWKKVIPLIVQSEGKPHVAPVEDPRPALTITPVRDEFVAADNPLV